MKKIKTIIVLLIIGLLFPIYSYSTNEINETRIEVKYKRIVDGDTAIFIINDEEMRVRFIGINTPESVAEDRPAEKYGKEASEFADEKLTNASKVEIEYEPKADKQDKFGRELAWIWVDGKLLEELLIKEGLATTYLLKDNYKYTEILKKAEEKAKNEGTNIWSEADILENEIEENTESNEINETNNKIYDIDELISSQIESFSITNTIELVKKGDSNTIRWLIFIVIIILIIVYILWNEKKIRKKEKQYDKSYKNK